MINRHLVGKQLDRIETHVDELRSLIRAEEILTDIRVERFAKYTLQLAIQAAVDVADHIVYHDQLGQPTTNGDLFDLLTGADWLQPRQVDDLKWLVELRNSLAHPGKWSYLFPDAQNPLVTERVKAVVEGSEHGLEDLLRFVDSIRRRISD